ncbi:MAG: hypothetical protein HUK21_11355 [Fibrobacteraceae bacterium]|nr:hypothetical protein [Fibrobacteraceae bacterium]
MAKADKEKIKKDWKVINKKIDGFLSNGEKKNFVDEIDDVPARMVDSYKKESFAMAVTRYIKFQWERKKNPLGERETFLKSGLERFKKYRQRARSATSMTAVSELQALYNFLCQKSSETIPGQILHEPDAHPFLSSTLSNFIRESVKKFEKEKLNK